MSEPFNVKIKSDGTPVGTDIFVDDVKLSGVTSVHWSIDISTQKAIATIKVYPKEIDVVGTVEKKT